MQKTVVINVVGLTPNLIGEFTPNLRAFAERGQIVPIKTTVPAVTCSVQSTYLTGSYPNEHGIVGNGWYFRDECEVKFWRQSNKLVQRPPIWEKARQLEPSFTCANMFWWYNMYSSVDYAVTPRPMYPADGRKLPDIYSQPAQMRPELQAELGQFPLFEFWGPNTTINSSQWIANASKWVVERHSPTLTLIYLPHLDYCLQRVGAVPHEIATDLQEIDAVCGDLITFFEKRGTQIIILSGYGIVPVSRSVHLNRLFRQQGWIATREELGRELLDAGECTAFAVADHQIAHIYVRDPAKLAEVKALVARTPGVAEVLDEKGKKAYKLDHPRSGELVALAEPDAWFTYYYWLDDERAPDFARTVDIHRKPGYDPVELFTDPQMSFLMAKIALTLAKKKLGFRYLMDVIPLDSSLVRGSHGRLTAPEEGALFITQQTELLDEEMVKATAVHDLILAHLQMERGGRR
jgi:predicted AlkP superfamily pyrophosphatase or phosphodiesterase